VSSDIAVVILTFNEELNVPCALASVQGWAREIVILDSFSNDRTVEICREAGCQVYQHKFEDYSKQRNWALMEIPISSSWILFLDADEWMTEELKAEIDAVIATAPKEDGYFLRRRLLWMGTWIRRGYYPTWILRLFRREKGKCDQRSCNEHIIVDGPVGYLRNDFIHEDRKSIGDWIAKHNDYARLEAMELLNAERHVHEVELRLYGGSPVEQSRWLRYKVWNRMPLLLRAVPYFLYRVILRGGFLDGPRAVVYHFFHALWYPLLIDVKVLEISEAANSKRSGGKVVQDLDCKTRSGSGR
jgi:glycosyltransferase involved in cell wall biosynthesis